MSWSRKRFGQSLFWARVRVEYLGLPRFTLVHDARILEFFHESLLPSAIVTSAALQRCSNANVLIIRVAHLQHFLAGEHVPGLEAMIIACAQAIGRPYHFSPNFAFAKRNKSCTLIKFTNAYPTLQPGTTSVKERAEDFGATHRFGSPSLNRGSRSCASKRPQCTP